MNTRLASAALFALVLALPGSSGNLILNSTSSPILDDPCECDIEGVGEQGTGCCPWIVLNLVLEKPACEPWPECDDIVGNNCEMSWDSIIAACPIPSFPYFQYYAVDGPGSMRAACGGIAQAAYRCPENIAKVKSLGIACDFCKVPE